VKNTSERSLALAASRHARWWTPSLQWRSSHVR